MCAMLDLKIRESNGNRKSLDDVMRELYQKYYHKKKRGFTDAEFRAECESAAGGSLGEVFEYASSTKEVDYAKYFALAGLKLDVTPEAGTGGMIGLDTQSQEIPPNEMPAGRGGRGRNSAPSFRLLVTDIAAGSPAARAGLRSGDRIIDVDGTAASAVALNDAVNARKAGEKIKLRVSRAGTEQYVEAEVAANVKKTYRVSPADGAAAAQREIFSHWLRKDL